MRKSRNLFVIFTFVTAFIFSCGIPTSIPILPKEVAIKASSKVSVPLGRVNYNLYSGINGGNMNGKIGGLNNLLGDSWLDDLLDQGVKIYDYRPSGSEDDTIQKFLLHYKLDMEGALGSSGDFDLSEYRDMINGLTERESETIEDVSFKVPSVDMVDTFDVKIDMGDVTGEIFKSINKVEPYTAYLPGTNTPPKKPHSFPDDILALGLEQNAEADFSVTLEGLDSLTFEKAKLKFKFTLTNDPSFPPPSDSTLKISGFKLRTDKGFVPTEATGSVVLHPNGDPGEVWISFNGVELPRKFDLVCHFEISGAGHGFFKLVIEPSFDDFTISGVKGLVLTEEQIKSLEYVFPGDPHPLDADLGPSFRATVETGFLTIDATQVFPPLATPEKEGWNLTTNLSELYIEQDDVWDNITGANAKGLFLGGFSRLLLELPDRNDLRDETLNNQPVKINGKVIMEIADNKERKLTFRNFPGGIEKGATDISYDKQLFVNLDVSLFSTVTAMDTDLGLEPEQINQEIEQDLGEDFTAFKDWLNYVQFEPGGLGAHLAIGTLNTAAKGLALYVDAPVFGLANAHRPLVNDSTGQNPQGAILNFTNEVPYTLRSEKLPDDGKLHIKVKLGLEDQVAQRLYEDTKKKTNGTMGIMTITNVVPGKPFELLDMKSSIVFDWAAMSVKPKPHASEGPEDPLPDYPFKGIYPDKGKGEAGIDLSGIPTGLVFPVPGRDGEDSGGMSASLYISLKRQILTDGGDWVDEEADDPNGEDYDETDPEGWRRNLKLNLPNLDFRVRYGDNDGDVSENLFSYNPYEEKSTGEWALFRPLDLDAEEFADIVKNDTENADNCFKIYSGSALPDPDKAIPIGNLAEVFNKRLAGEKDIYFDYTVELSGIPDNINGEREPGEIMLYPDMLEKKIVASADLLIVLPLKFKALQTDPDPAVPVVVTIAPDLGDEDLFGRKGPEDNEYFDLVKSLGFDINIKNLAGLSAGKFFLESKTGGKPYRTSAPIVDFSKPKNKFSLGSEELNEIKAIWPFVPRVSIEFKPGEDVRIERNFNIGLQSITIKAGGEYTFETGW
ncbi:MAG: hypothetical protein LBK63_10330 [Treponema sp.]|nr:hypothetical protein [Treponema sp.]